MGVRVNVATKYDVDFDEIGCCSADDAVRMIRKIQLEYSEDVVWWSDEFGTDFELSREELQALVDSGDLLGDPEADDLERFVRMLLDTGDPNREYVVVKIY